MGTTKKKKKVKLLLTSVGGLVSPGMIKSLRSCLEYDFFIIGADARKDAVGFYFADSSYIVPEGTSREYAAKLLKICRKEKVDVVLPLSDEETIALSRAKKEFEKNDIKITCSDYNCVRIASHKGLMLNFLKEKGICTPEFYLPKNIEELSYAAVKLGYPKKKIVFKPTTARGARGFWLLDANLNKQKWVLESRSRQEMTLAWLIDSLSRQDKFPDVIVMEYLPGDDFNVDVLASRGVPVYIIPNKRIVPDAGPVQVGHIAKNGEVQSLVAEVVNAFKFDYYVNIEIAYRAGINATPFIYEINPRISAPIIANKAAGVDLLLYGIKMALGEDFSKNLKIRETKMFRFWDEVFFSTMRHAH